uniref:Guanylate cyclase domain-containing protein n=1 Tax=Paraclostridium sordellii TaxID=1505 RepID=A0A2I6SWC1_PARSO|nr:adenylate/guanylate cyclase domain-containing protein [Paeniclostridium sordellii]AUO31838.1 hypothetical protein [Paeniclostridium sordellii]
MGFSKSDFDKVDQRIKKITEETVEQIEVDSDLPPTIEQLENNNKTYSVMAAILFIDIRKSTYLTENSQAKSMVKIYRSFMRMAVDCVRKNGGVTRQFLGDRIMGVFIDSCDDAGNIIDSAANKAINASRSLHTVIDYSLNKHLKNNVNGKIIECGIGIDYGKVLVTKVGMYGAENDENRENEVDCVWVGNTTNYASKYSDIASGGETFISESVFKYMSDEHKEFFTKSEKYKGSKLFQGYITRDYYLNFSEDLVKVSKKEEDSTVEISTSEQFAYEIKEIERLQNRLIKREKEISVFEEKLRKENNDLKIKLSNESSAKINAQIEKKEIKQQLEDQMRDTYSFIHTIINCSFYKKIEYIKNIGLTRWEYIEHFYHKLGIKLGYDEDEIKNSAYYFIEIFSYFKCFSKSYQYMVSMAKKNYVWVYIDEASFKWACEQYQGYQVIDAMEDNLKNNKIAYENIKSYEDYIERLKAIRGF